MGYNQVGQQFNEYRKNGDEYRYRGGNVQNWTNIENVHDRYAIFTDNASSMTTKFPGASITDAFVLKGAAYTFDNGSIHAYNSLNLSDLEHEYGHYLQALNNKDFFDYVIQPASLYSAWKHPESHYKFWTETDANRRATKFFGANSAIGQDDANHPKD